MLPTLNADVKSLKVEAWTERMTLGEIDEIADHITLFLCRSLSSKSDKLRVFFTFGEKFYTFSIEKSYPYFLLL